MVHIKREILWKSNTDMDKGKGVFYNIGGLEIWNTPGQMQSLANELKRIGFYARTHNKGFRAKQTKQVRTVKKSIKR